MAQCEKRASAGTTVQKKGMFHDRAACGEFETWSICSFSISETDVRVYCKKMKYFEKNQKMIDKRFLVVYD